MELVTLEVEGEWISDTPFAVLPPGQAESFQSLTLSPLCLLLVASIFSIFPARAHSSSSHLPGTLTPGQEFGLNATVVNNDTAEIGEPTLSTLHGPQFRLPMCHCVVSVDSELRFCDSATCISGIGIPDCGQHLRRSYLQCLNQRSPRPGRFQVHCTHTHALVLWCLDQSPGLLFFSLIVFAAPTTQASPRPNQATSGIAQPSLLPVMNSCAGRS